MFTAFFLEVSHTYATIFKLFTYIYSIKMAEKIFMVGILILVSKTTFPATITVLNEKNETIVTLPSLSAAFGPSLLNDKLVGHVWLTIPLNACIPVMPPTAYNSSLPFIGLVVRQNCSFVEKVLNVQKAGFKAALIFDPKLDDLITMSGSSGSILIPSFFIGKSSEQILSNYLEPKFSVEIEDNFTNSFGLFFIPLVIGMLLCLIFVIIFLLMRYTSGLVNQWRQRLSRSVLRLLPLRKFKKGDFYDTCAVCLEDFKVNDKLRILPCNHAYHQDCIDPWLTENRRTCPLCNKLILAQDATENPLEVPDEQTPLIANQATTLPSRRSEEGAPSSSRVLHDDRPSPQGAPA